MTSINPTNTPPPQPSDASEFAPIPDSSKMAAVFLGILQGDNYQQPPPAFGMDEANQSVQQEQAAWEAQKAADEQKWFAAAQAGGNPSASGPGGGTSGDWATDVLNRLGVPVTPQNLRVMHAWQTAEGGGSDGPSHSDFNWLNTTRVAPDAPYVGQINSVGVKRYASYEAGINATVGALTNGRYQNVLDALARGNDEYAVANAIANSPWGTGGGVLNVLNSQQSHATLR